MKKQLSVARVGFFILLGVILFVVAIFLIGEKSQFFSSTFYVSVNFASAEGVKPGAIVVLSGYNVGTVSDISLSSKADSVRLLLRIDEAVHRFIKQDSKAEIKQEGLVGNKIINIMIGSPDLEPIRNNGIIEGVPPFALTSLADNVTSITDSTKVVSGELKNLLVRLNRGQGTIGKFFTDDAVYENLKDITQETSASLKLTLDQLNRLAGMLNKMSQSVNLLVTKTDTTIDNANKITNEVSVLLENINSGKGTVGALLYDRKLYDSIVGLVAALTDISYDAGNAANQAAQSIHAMRRHWLLGRVFGGEDIDKEEAPVSSYEKHVQELKLKIRELDEREKRLRELEKKLGADQALPEKKK
jgi:phospholipid/cholesterol/gamma-HCH transport system substrate-binding protein